LTPSRATAGTRTAALLTGAILAWLGLGGCSAFPEAPEVRLLRARCGRCHPYDNALNKRKSANGWERTVWAMRQRGAVLSDAEAAQLVRYLVRERPL
jgi:hypothetical protein